MSTSSQISEVYHPQSIEPKWQKLWSDKKVFEVEKDTGKPKYYILEMFPYPSGRIHMGHVRNYSIGDVLARYKVARGFNVLHPMGWDAFGLPAENAAIKNKTHPAPWTYSNIAAMKKQIERLGWFFDWRREVATCTPEYYRWEQLFFLKMFEKGLAYRKLSTVNWCVSCNTVLANEQVEEGRCWRCENEVTTKELTQWFFKITAYADELLEGLKELSGWPERIKLMQEHWIGKSFGAEVLFEIASGSEKGQKISIFTTRVDTIGGVTFLSLAPEHPLTLKLAKDSGKEAEVTKFVDRIRKQDKIKRTDENQEKEGVFLGAHVLNPVTGEKVPVYAANFVLMEYGSGAVMAVPAHDIRDHAFAKKYNLPIRQVLVPVDGSAVDTEAQAYTAHGRLINTGEFSGLESEQALQKIPEWLEKKSLGKKTVNFKLRDWGVSRQRYWGAPIPIIHCPKCGAVGALEKDLPVVLPEDVEFTGEGTSPLSMSKKFLNVSCPKCGGGAQRDTDTMDTFMESSWYYIRFCTPQERLSGKAFALDDVKYWLPIDQYIGGVEHATMHLLYFRFFHRVLQDLSFLPREIGREPAKNLLNQGIVYKDGAKMSKSKGNVVDPDALVDKYGADTTKLFMLFAAPPEKVLEWSDQGVEGSYRFLGRVWRMVSSNQSLIQDVKTYSGKHSAVTNADAKKLRTKTHFTIRKVTEDLEHGFRFNTAISAIMELVNEIYAFKATLSDLQSREVLREAIESVVRLLCPFTPHMAEELWAVLKPENARSEFLSLEPWRDHDPEAVVLDEVKIVVQVNGKLRGEFSVPKTITKEEMEKLALSDTKVAQYVGSPDKIVKTIFVPGKLLNIVVKG